MFLALLFSLPSVPLDSRILPGNKEEPWALPGDNGSSRTLPVGSRLLPGGSRTLPVGSRALPGGSRALPGGSGGTMIIPIDIGPIVSVVASFTF